MILLSGREDLNTFVKENQFNPYYKDEQLYPFDGYAIKVFLEIADGRNAGVCIGTMCLEFSPNYSLSSFKFYSFVAKESFSP